MNTGQIISGAGHMGLIGWAFFGGMFTAEPLPFEFTEVQAISAEEFAALMAVEDAPEPVVMIDTPEPPDVGDAAPALSSQSDTQVDLQRPEISDVTPPDDVPVLPDRDVPEIAKEAPTMMLPPQDTAVLLPEISPRPKPRPVERIAPQPVAQPEPDVAIDEVEQPHTVPDETADTPVEETEPAAPEEATTEIVTEAEEEDAGGAPAVSLRPKARPNRPTETAEAEAEPTPDPEPEQAEDSQPSAIDQAIAAAAAAQADKPAGPKLTTYEKTAFRLAVQTCWNVGSLSSDALRTTVVVAFSLSEDGKPSSDSIRLVSSEGGSGSAVTSAFETARRAIIRCGRRGFPLPRDKYEHWRETIITFNPENMRIK